MRVFARKKRQYKRQQYAAALQRIYNDMLLHASQNKKTLVHVYKQIPCDIDGFRSTTRLRNYLQRKTDLETAPIFYENVEIGIAIRLP